MRLSQPERAFLLKLHEDGVLGFGAARDAGVIVTARSLKALHLVTAGLYGFTITSKGTKAAFSRQETDATGASSW